MIEVELSETANPAWYQRAKDNQGEGLDPVNNAYRLLVLCDLASGQQYMPRNHARQAMGYASNANLFKAAIT